jgi:hypothetical protein
MEASYNKGIKMFIPIYKIVALGIVFVFFLMVAFLMGCLAGFHGDDD